jgi:hypothetical protein
MYKLLHQQSDKRNRDYSEDKNCVINVKDVLIDRLLLIQYNLIDGILILNSDHHIGRTSAN